MSASNALVIVENKLINSCASGSTRCCPSGSACKCAQDCASYSTGGGAHSGTNGACKSTYSQSSLYTGCGSSASTYITSNATGSSTNSRPSLGCIVPLVYFLRLTIRADDCHV